MAKKKIISSEAGSTLERNFGRSYFCTGAYKDYRKVAREWVTFAAKKISKIIGKSSAKILDVGCAHGFLIAELQNAHGFRVRGLECSSFAIKNAEPTVKKKIRKGEILKMPFKKESFDAVLCLDVVNYLKNAGEVSAAVGNLVNVSKKYIFFSAISKYAWQASQKKNPDKLRKSVFSEKEYVNFFKQAGAKMTENFDGRNGGKILIFKKTRR